VGAEKLTDGENSLRLTFLGGPMSGVNLRVFTRTRDGNQTSLRRLQVRR